MAKSSKRIRRRPRQTQANPRRGAHGDGISRVISKRLRTEEDLRQSREQYARMIHASPDAITLRSLPDRRYLEVNEGFCRMTGYRAEEVLGKTSAELHVWADPEERRGTVETILRQGEIHEEEFRFRTKSGEIRFGQLAAVRVVVGDQLCILSVTRDITARKQAEEELRRSEANFRSLVEDAPFGILQVTLEGRILQANPALGRLAGGVAHDFNNLLGVVLGHTEILEEYASRDFRLHKSIEAIQNATRRASALTMQLLAFSRKQVVAPRILDLNAAAREIEKLLHRVIGEDIGLILRLHPHVSAIRMDPGQLDQVLMNLVVNARDAMPNGGKLILETGDVTLEEPYVGQHLGAATGSFVLLSISDTGCGMDQETLSHIFEPFFTTKEKGKGTGLGLSTVYGHR